MLANEISHVVRRKSGNFFQLIFVLEIFDCTIYNQIRTNKESILCDSLNSITLQRQT